MILLLDLGNTRLKFALLHEGEFTHRGAFGWDADIAHELATLWADWPTPERIVGASVVDGARETAVAVAAGKAFGHSPFWVRTPASSNGVANAYAEPHRLGVDRFLAMVDAFAAGRAPCVLASVGTALTLDALSADGRHLGGWIAPGPLLMQQSVLGATVQVRPDGAGTVRDLADNTADGLASGCWQACAALVERFVDRATPLLGGRPAVTLGGGDANLLAPLLDHEVTLVPDAVLRGLAVWATTHAQTEKNIP
ncbi:type III pantothenate kinase [Luteibacter sp. UNCMF366Tsu5.1]|uniref:type III pantothenate kinase n=1 Tax=Luteibacter sp. UNCMF366Tsu5.1 TaxID=1502758 RepID=UPI000908C1DA|nr:type III pantothenate kinase [Luteibacter sp. UNCMF366Tsu5.1]SFW41532.1 type III pantothenate kinase [Luteibacter sp. UNCMF366Tsu5.1]